MSVDGGHGARKVVRAHIAVADGEHGRVGTRVVDLHVQNTRLAGHRDPLHPHRYDRQVRRLQWVHHRVGDQLAQVLLGRPPRHVGALHPQLVLAHVERWQVHEAGVRPVGVLHDCDAVDIDGECQALDRVDVVERLGQVEREEAVRPRRVLVAVGKPVDQQFGGDRGGGGVVHRDVPVFHEGVAGSVLEFHAQVPDREVALLVALFERVVSPVDIGTLVELVVEEVVNVVPPFGFVGAPGHLHRFSGVVFRGGEHREEGASVENE